MLKWEIAESTVRPELVTYEPNSLLVVRNIKTVERDKITYYNYEYMRMTAQEYVNYNLEKRVTDAEDIILDMSEIIYRQGNYMASKIARLWADKLEEGSRNFNEVPEVLKDEVSKLIDEDGYKINPDGTVTKK